jgi:hypothetical protein
VWDGKSRLRKGKSRLREARIAELRIATAQWLTKLRKTVADARSGDPWSHAIDDCATVDYAKPVVEVEPSCTEVLGSRPH